jgi:hypothetical protein
MAIRAYLGLLLVLGIAQLPAAEIANAMERLKQIIPSAVETLQHVSGH